VKHSLLTAQPCSGVEDPPPLLSSLKVPQLKTRGALRQSAVCIATRLTHEQLSTTALTTLPVGCSRA
jgi:hypothetical protein